MSEALEDLQRTILRSRLARGACVSPSHDHVTSMLADGAMIGDEVALACWGCGEPAHYDRFFADYFHDDPSVPVCAFARSNRVNPCQPKAR